jgi:hypothetical protein
MVHITVVLLSHLRLVSASDNNVNVTSNPDDDIKGWIDQPNTRGTLDIVWNSLFTVFLCTWTVLCLNIPAEDDSFARLLWRKLRWMILTLMGPEFLLCFAIGQFAAAKRSVTEFKRSGYDGWTMEHGFFADMGGFVLAPHESQKFPVNAKQLHYLVTKGYIPMPEVTKKGIKDRTKADAFAKLLTIVQTSWFLLQVLGRAISHLGIATLELTAVAVVVCTLGTFYCWLKKPLDVEVPITVPTKATAAQILIEGGDAAMKPYRQTPLDFVDDLTPSWSINVMSRFGLRTGPRRRPLRRLGNCRIPKLDRSSTVLLFALTHIYGSMHMLGWSFGFSTPIERLLWRIASSTIFVTTFLFWAIDRGEAWRHDRKYKWWVNLILRGPQEPEQVDPNRGFHAPAWVLATNSVIACCYTTARLYLFFEGFAGLRKLPASTFVCVQWNDVLPHIN